MNGQLVPQNTYFVVGNVSDVEAGFGLGEANDEPAVEGEEGLTRSEVTEFNSPDALTDVVVITLAARTGVAASGEVPWTVRIALPLPAPTDLPTLRTEFEAMDEVGAIVFPAVGLAVEDRLFEILDSRYLGTSSDQTWITFGEILVGPHPDSGVERVEIAAVLRGAGTIDLLNEDGDRAKES